MRGNLPSKKQSGQEAALNLRLVHLAESGLCEAIEPEKYRSDLLKLIQRTSGSKGLANRADFFKALADEIRLKMVYALMDREMCECELTAALDLSQPTISHHLSILQRSQIVKREKRGKWAFYRISDSSVKEILLDTAI